MRKSGEKTIVWRRKEFDAEDTEGAEVTESWSL
jgi:hypothetical protein